MRDSATVLPTDILSDILVRLPAEYIMTCRCVCKEWSRLTKEPEFVRMHYETAKLQPRRLMFNSNLNTKKTSFTVQFDGSKVEFATLLNFGDVCKDIADEELLVNSVCNGMLCLSTRKSNEFEERTWIYNPITKKCITLPRSVLMDFGYGSYGFGFDSVNNRYKVVRVFNFFGATMGQIITLGESSWRLLHFPQPVESDGCRPVYSNSGFHWLIRQDENTLCTDQILVLNIVTEKFETMLPCTLCMDMPVELRLMNIEESLALLEEKNCEYGKFKIWTLSSSEGEQRVYQTTYNVSKLAREFLLGIRILGISNGSFLFCGWGKDGNCSNLCFWNNGAGCDPLIEEEPVRSCWTSLFVPSLFCPNEC